MSKSFWGNPVEVSWLDASIGLLIGKDGRLDVRVGGIAGLFQQPLATGVDPATPRLIEQHAESAEDDERAADRSA